MDGSYMNPMHGSRGQNQSPITPSTPTYQVNVSRQKTRKWVEAKVQNYDGDDWGGDEYGDDDDEEDDDEQPQSSTSAAPPASTASSQLPSVTQRSASGQHPAATSTADGNGPPPLSVQTQPAVEARAPAAAPKDNTPPVVSGPSSMSSPSDQTVSESLVSPQSTSAFRAADPSLAATVGDVSTPVSAGAKNSPLVRPSDIYRRMEEEKEKERQSLEGARPPTEAILEQATSPLQTSMSADAQTEAPAIQESVRDVPAHAEDRNRFSTSPKLPDLARMSTFGVDFFNKPTGDEPPVPALPQQPPAVSETIEEEAEPEEETQPKPTSSEPIIIEAMDTEPQQSASTDTASNTNDSGLQRPPLPGGYMTEDPAHADDSAFLLQPRTYERPEVSPISEQGDDTAKGFEIPVSVKDDDSEAMDRVSHRSLTPLQTPKLHEASPAPALSTSERPESTDVSEASPALVQPLQPRIPEDSPSDYSPQVLNRASTYGTGTSSPLKESDVLRDEIIKSLSPTGGASSSQFEENRRSMAPGARESSYTLSGYDDYWADSGKPGSGPASRTTSTASKGAPEVPADATPVPPLPKPIPEEPKVFLPSGPVITSMIETPPPSASLRRRFSWEAEAEAGSQSSSQTPAESSRGGPSSSLPVPVVNAPDGSDEKQVSPISESSKPSELEVVSPPISVSTARRGNESDDGPEIVVPPVTTAEPRRSSISKDPIRTSGGQDTIASEASVPPAYSPTDDHAQTVPDTPSSAHASATAPLSATVAPSGPASGKVAVIPFRTIMNMPSSPERIEKFEETRGTFSSMDSGSLENWLHELKSQHAEYANAGPSFYGGAPPGNAPPGAKPPPMAAGQASQTAYYQQYLNASSPAPAGSPAGRTRIGGLPIPPGATSGFSHSGNQVGAKSKELMQSAGKMGKGLLSKGRSKLRGTGDKQGEPESPKTKPDRRSSWALGLGPRNRTEGVAPHSSQHGRTGSLTMAMGGLGLRRSDTAPVDELPPTRGSLSTREPPQLPMLPQASPFETEAGDKAPWSLPKIDTSGEVWDEERKKEHYSAAGRSPRAALDTQVAGQSGGQGTQSQPPQPASSQEPSTSQPNHQTPSSSRYSQDFVSRSIGSAEPRSASQYNASFKGLPPIRRGSTFGLGFKSGTSTTPAKERFSMDEFDDAETAVGTITGTGTHDKTLMSSPGGEVPPVPDLPGGFLNDGEVFGSDMARTHTRTADEDAAQRDGTQAGRTPSEPNPIQHLPPSGPWKLEESHLSEPLHPSRNRAGTEGSQQVLFGIDKETGEPVDPETETMTTTADLTHAPTNTSTTAPAVPPIPANVPAPAPAPDNVPRAAQVPAPMPPPPSQQYGPPGRSKTSDVPPSSAQRYPDLFHQRPEQQRPRADSRSMQQYPPQNMETVVDPRGTGSEFTIPGVRPPSIAGSEKSGRQRSGSGILNDISGVFSRATRTRSNSGPVADPRPPTPLGQSQALPESTHVSEVMKEPKKKRSSFMGLRSRSSTDQTSMQGRASTTDPRPSISDLNRVETNEPQRERKRSFFGSMSNMSSTQLKSPGQVPQSSASSFAYDQSVDGSQFALEDSQKPNKKRLSGFAKMKGVFSRSDEQAARSGTPHSFTSMGSSQAQGSVHTLGQPTPGFGLSRSATRDPVAMSSHGDMAPPPAPAPEEGRRSRRGSAAEILSGWMGHMPGMKGKEAEQPQQYQESQQYQQPRSQQSSPMGQQFEPPAPQPGMRSITPPPSQRLSMQAKPSPLGQRSPITSTESPTDLKLAQMVKPEPPVGAGHERTVSDQTQVTVDEERREPAVPTSVSPDLTIRSADRRAGKSPEMKQGQRFDTRMSPPHPQQEFDENGKPLPPPLKQMPLPQPHFNPGLGKRRVKDPDLSPVTALNEQMAKTFNVREPVKQHSSGPRPGLGMDLSSGRDSPQGRSPPLPLQQQPRNSPQSLQNSRFPPAQPAQQAPQVDRQTPQGVFQSNARITNQFYSQGYRPSDPALRQNMAAQQNMAPRNMSPQNMGQDHTSQQDRTAMGPGGLFSPQARASPDANRTPTHTPPNVPHMQAPQGPPQGPPHGYLQQPPQGHPHASPQGDMPGFAQRPTSNHQNGVPPFAQAQQDAQGSRWKGLRNRVSEQMSNMSHPTQDKTEKPPKPEKDEKTSKADKRASGATKFLGAFKRGSKQVDPGQQQQQQQQNFGFLPHAGQQMPAIHGQGPYDQQRQLLGQNPPTAQPGYQGYQGQASGQYGNSMQHQHQQQQQQHQQHQQQSMPVGQPGTGQWPLGPASGQNHGYGQDGAPTSQPQQQQSPPMQQQGFMQQPPMPEPQYGQVPIPRGYTAVHGEGISQPSAYNVNRMPPGGYYTNPQQGQHQRRQVSAPMQGMMQHGQGQGQPQDQAQGQFGDRRASAGPGFGSPPQPQHGFQQMRPDNARGLSDVSILSNNAPATLGLADMTVVSPPLEQRGFSQSPPQPKTSFADDIVTTTQPATITSTTSQAHLAVEQPRVVSFSPPNTPGDRPMAKKRPSNVDVDAAQAKKASEDDLYDATPRLNQDSARNSTSAPAPPQSPPKKRAPMSRSTSTESGALGERPSRVKHESDPAPPKQETKLAAELADTADAHERKTRLESQEEKIYYDPKDDAAPQMSATSYPGQEWNPYGEPGFGDWEG